MLLKTDFQSFFQSIIKLSIMHVQNALDTPETIMLQPRQITVKFYPSWTYPLRHGFAVDIVTDILMREQSQPLSKSSIQL